MRHDSLLALAVALSALVSLAAAASLLTELPASEGADLVAPYELWVATFASEEGSYGSGPRILVITNDRTTAVAYVNGERTELQHVGDLAWQCEPGGSMRETYKSDGITLQIFLTTSPGEEACWVEGTVTITVGATKQSLSVKGASGV